MVKGSVAVKVGDKVTTATKLGKMGNTGNSFGTHLHLELSKTKAWNCNNFLDPLKPLGIPNKRGTIIEYDGTAPEPEPPSPDKPTDNKNNTRKWLMFMCKKAKIFY